MQGSLRTTLTVLALASALPVCAVAGTAAAPEAAAPVEFKPPTKPLVVTRTVWRGLRDGAQIVVRRSYLIEFAPADDGFIVSGRQVGCEVEAPPALAGIARMERERVDTGAFPLRLDVDGKIRLGSAPAAGPAALQGREAARALLAGAALAEEDRRESEAFLAGVAGSGMIPWPVDLFNPREANRSDQRAVSLPGGASGQITISFAAAPRRADGLPGTFSREVVSEVAGDRRVSREEWTFAERAGP